MLSGSELAVVTCVRCWKFEPVGKVFHLVDDAVHWENEEASDSLRVNRYDCRFELKDADLFSFQFE